MNAPRVPAVRYRTAKPLDRALNSSRRSSASISHRATLTLDRGMAAHNLAHRVVNKESVVPQGAIRTEGGLKEPAAAVNHRDGSLRCATPRATGTIVETVRSV